MRRRLRCRLRGRADMAARPPNSGCEGAAQSAVSEAIDMTARYALRFGALGYLAFLLLVPVLREIGTDQEQAAETLGAAPFTTFRRITLPAIRWAVGYGVVLTTARAIGEFGAVSVVSGRIEGKTETLPLYVQSQFEGFNTTGAFAASVVLALIALATVLCMRMFRPKEEA